MSIVYIVCSHEPREKLKEVGVHTVRAPTLQGFILSYLREDLWDNCLHNRVRNFFWFFCRSSFINNFMVKNNSLESKNHRQLNFSRRIYFKKISPHRFVGLIYTNKLEEFFKNFFFQGLGALFTTAKPQIWASFFSTKKLILYFKGDYLLLIYY